jgi:putative ABC transport system permease protein
MNVFVIALRNLQRNRRRSLATVMAMVVGLVAMLLFGGYSRNAVLGMETGYVQLHGHLQIQRQGYFLYGSGNPAAYGIAGYREMMAAIKGDPVLAPMLAVVTPKLQLGGIAGNFAAGVSTNVIASGIEPADQNRMRAWDDYGASAAMQSVPLTGTAVESALIGTGVARMLQLCTPLKVENCPQPPTRVHDGNDMPADLAALSAGDARPGDGAPASAIEMLATNAHGVPNVARLNVVSAKNMGLKEFDDVAMVMHLDQAQRLVYGSEAPQVTAIQLQLQHSTQIPAARARLTWLLSTRFKQAQVEVLDFRTLAPIYEQTIEFFDSVFGFISVLIGTIVLFTVGNTMSAAVLERTAEIGTLRAIGQRRAGVRTQFVSEAALLGLIGAALGTVMALLLAWAINHGGLTWTPPGYVYAYPLRVRVWGDNGLMAGSALALVVIALLSAWWPAHRGARLQIVDALRHV